MKHNAKTTNSISNSRLGRTRYFVTYVSLTAIAISLISLLLVVIAVISGCDGSNEFIQQTKTNEMVNANYLCVGMEMSNRFGSCPGCEKDARRLSDLLSSKYGYSGLTLISSQATKERVVQELKKGIESTDEDGLFLFLYSGHGGQEYMGGHEPDGADSKDEFLCLYDNYMLDDEIWEIVSKCRGRVFLYFDACHSETMYRSVSVPIVKDIGSAMSVSMVKTKGFMFRPRASAMSEGASPRLMCWSGCKEFEYSYGSSSGGIMTNVLMSRWSIGKTYGSMWNEVLSGVGRQRPDQHPVCTVIGGGFEGEVFR